MQCVDQGAKSRICCNRWTGGACLATSSRPLLSTWHPRILLRRRSPLAGARSWGCQQMRKCPSKPIGSRCVASLCIQNTSTACTALIHIPVSNGLHHGGRWMQAGGTSLQTGAVCSCVRKALGLKANIPAAWLFTGQTVRALASRISHEVLAPNASCSLALLPAASKAQAALADANNVPMVLSFQQVCDVCMAVAA